MQKNVLKKCLQNHEARTTYLTIRAYENGEQFTRKNRWARRSKHVKNKSKKTKITVGYIIEFRTEEASLANLSGKIRRKKKIKIGQTAGTTTVVTSGIPHGDSNGDARKPERPRAAYLDDDAAHLFAVGGHVKEHFRQAHFVSRFLRFRGIRRHGRKTTSERMLRSGAAQELPAGE